MPFVLVAFSGAVADAQSIVGNIATPLGVPIEGVRVNGTQIGGLGRLTTVTDAAGNYRLAPI